MKRRYITAILLAGIMTVSVLTGCGNQTDTVQSGVEENTAQEENTAPAEDAEQEKNTAPAEGEEISASNAISSDVLMIARQGMFSSGGTVTEPVEGGL